MTLVFLAIGALRQEWIARPKLSLEGQQRDAERNEATPPALTQFLTSRALDKRPGGTGAEETTVLAHNNVARSLILPERLVKPRLRLPNQRVC